MERHIDFAVFPKKHTAMYLMHKYWERKLHNVVAEYIRHYTRPGDLVFELCPLSSTAYDFDDRLKGINTVPLLKIAL